MSEQAKEAFGQTVEGQSTNLQLSLVAPSEDSEPIAFDPKEVVAWHKQINSRTRGDYLSNPNETLPEVLIDETLAVLALYAVARNRTRSLGLKPTLDQLVMSLDSGVAVAAEHYQVTEMTIHNKKAQAASRIATELDRLVGGFDLDRPEQPEKAPPAAARTQRAAKKAVSSGAHHPGDDNVKIYLKEIGKTPLLDAEKEVELSKRIEAGLVAEKVLEGSFDFNNQYTEEELEWIAQEGREAYELFIKSNLRLAVNLAAKYRNSTTTSMQFEDRIQVGNEGLFRAVEKFDYTKGYKFSTYATWWIRQSIQRGLADQSRTIRVPVHMQEVVNKVAKAERKLGSELEREPTDDELARELEMDLDKIKRIREIVRIEPFSLNRPLGEDGGEIGDLIEGPDGRQTIEDFVNHKLLLEEVAKYVDSLPEREAIVVKMRFGMDGADPAKLDEVGQQFGLTRERIRQIQANALRRLAQDPHLRKIYEELVEREE